MKVILNRFGCGNVLLYTPLKIGVTYNEQGVKDDLIRLPTLEIGPLSSVED